MIEVIDLFCGAGGVTTGIEKAKYRGIKCANVIACINHDPVAIASHAANHKGVLHFTEDITQFDFTKFPAWTPGAVKILWASLECTNFSNAKGGLPKEKKSRTLGEHLYRRKVGRKYVYHSYIQHLDPHYILVENVREFMTHWGPLDKTGKVIKGKKDIHFKRWVKTIKKLGYTYTFKMINCADHGARTTRKRLFICFAKHGLPVLFPPQTHSKISGHGLKKWKPVKDVINFSDEGYSIFDRKTNTDIPPRFRKNISPKTFRRIYRGLVK